MNPISVVIIAKNEAANIQDCVKSALQVSNDIIVADSGSEDLTQDLSIQAGARLLQVTWKGYGQTRNEAAKFAENEWILALDADERLTTQLALSINNLSLANNNIIYGFKIKSFLGSKKIKFGEWGRQKIYRLYNRQHAQWDSKLVHEKITGRNITRKIIPGELFHYTMKDLEEFKSKTILYATLSAKKYAAGQKKATWIKRFISPVFSIIQNYIFRLGFLDGKEGWIIALTSAKYVFLKYKFLHQLNHGKTMPPLYAGDSASEQSYS
jgi:glycosyltransferase involved in cell wall biosynthesis